MKLEQAMFSLDVVKLIAIALIMWLFDKLTYPALTPRRKGIIFICVMILVFVCVFIVPEIQRR